MVHFVDASSRSRAVLFRAPEGEWDDYVSFGFAGSLTEKEQHAISEVIRVLMASEPKVKQLLVQQYALVESPYIHRRSGRSLAARLRLAGPERREAAARIAVGLLPREHLRARVVRSNENLFE